MDDVGTNTGFLNLIQALKKLERLDINKTLKEFEEVESKFEIVDKELLTCLRKHFNEKHLELKEVKLGANAGAGGLGTNVEFVLGNKNKPPV
jgi:hypothetical protein